MSRDRITYTGDEAETMFENKTIFALVKENRKDKIYRVEVDADTQEEINQIFSISAEELFSKQHVAFTGSYTPLEDEALFIQGFNLDDDIKDAFRNPVTAESYNPKTTDIQNVRAICIGFCEPTAQGEKFTAAFQRLRKDQYISVGKLRLFFDDKTFKKDTRSGLAVGEQVDCVFIDEKLYFTSYFFARQIFDLNSYYRTANDRDVDAFIASEILDFGETSQQFKEKANSWTRRKVALINDSGVLDQFTAVQIKKLAKQQSGIEIKVQNKKIIFPEEPDEIKLLLGFLDEEAYQGPFSKDTFLSTSKRKINK